MPATRVSQFQVHSRLAAAAVGCLRFCAYDRTSLATEKSASTFIEAIENNPTLHQAVTKSLALKVSSGGTKLLIFPSEAELCQQLGVSRSILREAVKMLSAKRMLEVRQLIAKEQC